MARGRRSGHSGGRDGGDPNKKNPKLETNLEIEIDIGESENRVLGSRIYRRNHRERPEAAGIEGGCRLDSWAFFKSGSFRDWFAKKEWVGDRRRFCGGLGGQF